MATDKSDLLQGTLDLLILKVVALGPPDGERAPNFTGRVTSVTSRVRRPPAEAATYATLFWTWTCNADSCGPMT